MLRTLLTLKPSTTKQGVPVLRGTLPRDTVTTDEAGHTRRYPRGCEVVLRKQGQVYALLAVVEDELPPPLNQSAIAEANRHDREFMGKDAIPY
jgi:hypothetical protein